MKKIIVGLGNPGPKYETTRHNIGFLALDHLVHFFKASGPIKKNEAELYEASFAGEKIFLIKPQTYMNLSGKSVGPLFHFHKCAPEDLIVIHDDVDLKPLSIRIKTGGGTGGHNGLKSLDEHLGNKNNNYHRIRLGIGRSDQLPVEKYVLQMFSDEELKNLPNAFEKTQKAIELS